MSIFAMALEGASAVSGVDSEMTPVSAERMEVIESTITEDPNSLTFFCAECCEGIVAANYKAMVAEGYYGIKYLQATSEEQRQVAMEGVSDKIEDAWEAIKRFVAEAWEAIKKYVKKAWDYLKKRAALGRAMLTKYEKVLRSKKYDGLVDWPEINIQAGVTARIDLVKKIEKPFALTLRKIEEELNRKTGSNDISDQDFKNAMDNLNAPDVLKKAIYSNENGLVENAMKKWNSVKGEIYEWADADGDKILKEYLGNVEANTNSINKDIKAWEAKLIKEAKDTESDAIKAAQNDTMKAFARKASASARANFSRYARAVIKINNITISYLQTAIAKKQALAIAACRQVITSKDTTEKESYIKDDFDSVVC